jgi:hypothetical protein
LKREILFDTIGNWKITDLNEFDRFMNDGKLIDGKSRRVKNIN